MRPSLSVLSKASRAPLVSKQANKEFYKGLSLPLPFPSSHHTKLTGYVSSLYRNG